MKFFLRCLALSLVVLVNANAVEMRELPPKGIQPRVLAGADGAQRLVYYQGDAAGGDLFYERVVSSKDPLSPLRINSQPGSAVALGTIRGAQAALGKKDRLHVFWNGARSKSSTSDNPPMFYTRLSDDEKTFEPQRALSGEWILDGGGAVAADAAGRVYVFWHGGNGKGEGERRILMRLSLDDGKSFEPERVLSPEGEGVCGCCAMQALATGNGGVFVLYRTASDGGKNRDIALLVSHDGGQTFRHKLLDHWAISACPMTSMSLADLPQGVVGAWEKEGKIRLGYLEKEGGLTWAAGDRQPAKYPSLAFSPDGRLMVAWSEGAGWQRSGTLAWQMFDAALNPVSRQNRGQAGEVPVWSFPCAVAQGSEFEIWR